jgi:hypothetical protein
MRRHQGGRKQLFSPAEASNLGFLGQAVQLLDTVTVEHQTRWHRRPGRQARLRSSGVRTIAAYGPAAAGLGQYLLTPSPHGRGSPLLEAARVRLPQAHT